MTESMLLAWITCAIAAGLIAKRKAYSSGATILAILFGPVGLLVVAFGKDKNPDS